MPYVNFKITDEGVTKEQKHVRMALTETYDKALVDFLVLVVFFVGIRIRIGIGKETGGKSTTSLVSLNCWCPTTSSSDPTISSAVLCWFTWFVWWLPRGVRIGYHFTC